MGLLKTQTSQIISNNTAEDTSLDLAEKFNVQEHKTQKEMELRQSQEVQSIVSSVDVTNTKSILTFGSKPAQEVSKFSDQILNSMELTKVEDTGKMLEQLTKIMDKFDIKDFEAKKQGFLEKIFSNAKNSIEALFNKYHTMGDEVEKVSVILKGYETEIYQANDSLEKLFKANLKYYEELQKYIVAGEIAVEELKTEIMPQLESKAEQSGDQADQLTVANTRQLQDMFEQRVYDLRLAENIALQSIPMIQTMQYNNYNLIRKINSAFIITLPIFKRCLAQAILLKRQSVQAKATQAFEEKTKEMLLRNAENTAEQSRMIAGLANSSVIDIDTLAQTWRTIMKGIEDTKQINNNAKLKREEDAKRLKEFAKQYEEKEQENVRRQVR